MIGTRPFGYDRQPVPEMGMGCYRITTNMGVDRPTALATLQRAYELGVRFFDTAPLYGAGEADALLGEAFAHGPDDDIVIGAKLSGPTDNLWDYTYDNCMRGFEQTLRHLKRDLGAGLANSWQPRLARPGSGPAPGVARRVREGHGLRGAAQYPRAGWVQVHWRDEPLVAAPPALSGARRVRQRGDCQPLQPADERSPGGRSCRWRSGPTPRWSWPRPCSPAAWFRWRPWRLKACVGAGTPRRQ